MRTIVIMRSVMHWIAHRWGMNGGTPESHWDGGELIMCFRCAGCGSLDLCHATGVFEGL